MTSATNNMLAYRDGRYEWLGGYDSRHIPKEAGFRWDPQDKVWWTEVEDVAAKLAQHTDDDVKKRLAGSKVAAEQAETASRATDADVDIPVPAGLEYMPFQKAGIAYCLKRFGDLQ